MLSTLKSKRRAVSILLLVTGLVSAMLVYRTSANNMTQNRGQGRRVPLTVLRSSEPVISNDAVIEGVGVLISNPKQVMVVNVVGKIDPDKINNLRGQFGIPKDFALDFGGMKMTHKRTN